MVVSSEPQKPLVVLSGARPVVTDLFLEDSVCVGAGGHGFHNDIKPLETSASRQLCNRSSQRQFVVAAHDDDDPAFDWGNIAISYDRHLSPDSSDTIVGRDCLQHELSAGGHLAILRFARDLTIRTTQGYVELFRGTLGGATGENGPCGTATSTRMPLRPPLYTAIERILQRSRTQKYPARDLPQMKACSGRWPDSISRRTSNWAILRSSAWVTPMHRERVGRTSKRIGVRCKI